MAVESGCVGPGRKPHGAAHLIIVMHIDKTNNVAMDLWMAEMITAMGPGSEVIKLFSCSTQLSMKFQLLIYTQIAKINGTLMF